MTTCKNCGHTFEGNYCNHCRQSAVTERVTWKELFHQFRQAVLDVDRGILFTIREMFLRPGITLQSYLDGKRVNHSNPFLFVLLASGITSLLFMTFDVDPLAQAINLDKIERVSPMVAQKHFVLVGTYFISMFAISDWILYRRSKLNFAELLTVNAFQAGQILTVTVLLFPLLLIQDRFMLSTGMFMDVRLWLKVLIMGYLIWVRFQFFGRYYGKASLLMAVFQFVGLILLYEFVVAREFMRLITN